MDGCLLTLDIGSSSVRARLYDPGLRAIGVSGAALRACRWRMEGGAMEADADDILAGAVGVIDAALESAATAGAQVRGVGIATFWHSLLGLADDGRPATPLFGWGDARAAAAADRLRQRLDEEEYHRRTGCFLHSAYPVAKLEWLRSSGQAAIGGVRHWASFADYLETRLFGTRRTSVSIASATGLLNLATARWDEPTLAALGLDPAQLPEIVDLEPVAGLLPAWAARWPALARVPWLSAAGDGACANLGSGAVGPHRPGLTVGTSAAVRVLGRDETGDPPAPELWSYRLDREHRVSGGALSNGGNALVFLREAFAGLDFRVLDRALREEEPGRHGLSVLPSLVPERAPAWSGERAAGVVGITHATRAPDIARAWLEAIAQRTAALLQRVEAAYGEARELRASGGAFRVLPGWLQLFADATGRPVRHGRDSEATSRGAAILAARAIGWLDALEAVPQPEGTCVEPVPARLAVHREAAARGERLAAALRPPPGVAAPSPGARRV
jgi:gluconokinase